MADNIISEVELEMGISIEHLIDEFGKIRTGRANPSLVTVSYTHLTLPTTVIV